MSPIIDFGEVQGLEPVPAGTYKAEVVFAQEGASKAGQPKIDLRYKIIGGEQDGRQVLDTMSFHPQALWRTKLSLQAMGFAKDFSGEIDAGDLIGREVTIVVAIEESSQTDEDGDPYPPRNRVVKVKKAQSNAASVFGTVKK